MSDTAPKVATDSVKIHKGRQKGTSNKCSFQAKQIAEEMGIDPFRVLLMVVAEDWEGLGYDRSTHELMTKSGEVITVDRITLDHRLTAAKEATKYLYQQLKAVEHSGSIESKPQTLEEFVKQQNENKE